MIKTAVEIKNVSHQYKGSNVKCLNNVSLRVKDGETLLLCGPSGSGKTSIIRLMNGLIPHYYPGVVSGSITVAGKDVIKTELYELAGIVGTVFQNPRSQFFSVETDGEIVFGPENIGLAPEEIIERKKAIVEQLNLKALLGRSLFELSGGEKQRIACASVATLLPDIILLDEPSSNLDEEAIEKLHDIITIWTEEGKTIVISEHRLWYLMDLTDRVVFLEDGCIRHEWTGDAFAGLGLEEIRTFRLRPTVLKECNAMKKGNRTADMHDVGKGTSDGIVLRDFYFSYHRCPYIIRKKKFSETDGDGLVLCIPELFLPKGKVIGVVGRNGTGKSTFLRCVCGLENDYTGTVEADGVTYRGRRRIGFSYMVMQDVNHQLFTDSVRAEVVLSMKEKDEEKCHEILHSLGLLAFRDTHPMALSGGQKQRVAIASAIAAGAKLLLFDEPTSGLDFAHMEQVGILLKQLADAGNTVLVSTHDPELLDMCCDVVLRIDGGRISDYFCYNEKEKIGS